jgi:peptidyl-prolyl cis-trans isomerase C
MEIRNKVCVSTLAIVLAVACVAGNVWADKEQAKGNTAEDKVAVVNGSVITQTDFDREVFRTRQMYNRGKNLENPGLKQIKKEALDHLIERELLYQESKNQGITVDEATVKSRIDGLRDRFPSDEAFKEGLEKMNLSKSILETQLRQGMAIQELIEKAVAQKVTVSEGEAKEYYDNHQDRFQQPKRVRAKHILVKVEPGANNSEKAEARKTLKSAQERLQEGEDFSSLAEEISDCPSSKKGGDLGYFSKGQMVKPFEEAAFALEPGQVSDIVETRFGYHLIELQDKQEASIVPYDEAKDRLMEQLKQQKIREEITKYVAGLKKDAKIETEIP